MPLYKAMPVNIQCLFTQSKAIYVHLEVRVKRYIHVSVNIQSRVVDQFMVYIVGTHCQLISPICICKKKYVQPIYVANLKCYDKCEKTMCSKWTSKYRSENVYSYANNANACLHLLWNRVFFLIWSYVMGLTITRLIFSVLLFLP